MKVRTISFLNIILYKTPVISLLGYIPKEYYIKNIY